MLPGQPEWNISKAGNDADQWNIYDDNNNGRFIGCINGEGNAKIASAAPEMLALLQEMYKWTYLKHTPWAIRTREVLNKAQA